MQLACVCVYTKVINLLSCMEEKIENTNTDNQLVCVGRRAAVRALNELHSVREKVRGIMSATSTA